MRAITHHRFPSLPSVHKIIIFRKHKRFQKDSVFGEFRENHFYINGFVKKILKFKKIVCRKLNIM